LSRLRKASKVRVKIRKKRIGKENVIMGEKMSWERSSVCETLRRLNKMTNGWR
jgi:hypothetical protein